MADGQGNINRPHTGTVPKIKYSNNAKEQTRSPRMSNNLVPPWHMHVDSHNFIHDKRRNQRNRYLGMEVAMEGSEISNGVVSYPINGITPNSSSSASRRDSVGSTPKCENVAKYPDRKQIEDKLSQIREYLDVTSSLMTSIRNSDEQIFDIDEKTNLTQMRNDLLDSERKLIEMLQNIDNNENAELQDNDQSNIDTYSEHSSDFIKRAESDFNSFDNELTALRDQQMSLLKLHQKSENRLVDARHVQERMATMTHNRNSPGSNSNLDPQKSNNNASLSDFDSAIRELEERTQVLNRNRPASEKLSTDKLMSEMQNLQSQIVSMHDANNEREQIIQVLDNKDTELRSQQAELKRKLMELQTKKDQVDQLTMQLQMLDEDPVDVGNPVQNMFTVKHQLSKLKDMLDVINNTTEHASPAEVQAATNEICLTAENLQNEISKPSHKRNDSFVENRLDNHVSNETYQKQVNKSQRNQGARPKQRTSSINEKLALQSELEAKKRELEEIMGKHKAATSNLNHDVRGNPGNDMSWKPPIFCQDQESEERLSSDPDENEYSEIQEENVFPQYFGSNISNRCPSNRSECELPSERISSALPTPERNLRGISRQQAKLPQNNRNQEKQDKLQKQLELIKSVCDSVLDQIPNNNIQQVRNNIAPSIYADQQRVSCSPSPFRPNQVNVFQPNQPNDWYQNGQDMGGYQNWLATNSLQTQSFMLNTLNQCCQMLWLQQRELAQLRTTVNGLQDRLDHNYHNQQPPPPPPLPYQPPTPNMPNHLRLPTPQKTNQVSAACSLPNLNQYPPVTSQSDLAYPANNALLESCLNNVSNLNFNSNHHAVPEQIWNGQALNNQVAPGNRANNYWDNFRSYSRQNQLSSKNSESSIHNVASGLDRFHLERVNPFPLITTSKSNSEHSSTNSRENTPRKRTYIAPRHIENVNQPGDHHAPPPDVLNVNQNLHKSFEPSDLASVEPRINIEDLGLHVHRLLNISPREGNDEQRRQRNEWQDGQLENQRPKMNKLVEELRENVYKEVASLISANEARPHFLIQLFKDLQKIESDSLRLKILQSVQNILTQSLNGAATANTRQMTESDSTLSESSEQASMWSRPTKQFSSGILNMRLEGDEPFLQNSYKEIVSLLESNEDDVIGGLLLANIKQVFLESDLLKDSVRDTVFLKHFSNVLDDALEQYRGKKVHDVKIHLIQTIGDLLQGELSFIHLIQETIPDGVSGPERKDSAAATSGYNVASALFDIPNQGSLPNDNQTNDLTEADQSRLNDSEIEEEGAVGGIVESPEEESQITTQSQEEEMLNVPIIDFPGNGEGLDQVPTRLATKLKSGAASPSKDLINSHHDTEPY